MKFVRKMRRIALTSRRSKHSSVGNAEELERRMLLSGAVAFAAPVTYTTGNLPRSLILADLNNDGNLDAVYVNTNDSTVGVMLGNGDGTFQAQQTFVSHAASSPQGVAVGDINGDGKPDLIVTNTTYGTVGVLFGNGDGTFQVGPTFFGGDASPNAVALADVNGDGKADLIVGLNNYSAVNVLLGNGDGTFQAPTSNSLGAAPATNPNIVRVADLNGDGKLDIVATEPNSNVLAVLMGNGDGTFQVPQTYTVDRTPFGVTIADVNGDGKPDLISGNYYGNDVSVLLGNGDGTFQAQTTFAAGGLPRIPAVADLNGDGNLDLIVTTESSAFSVLLGNGDGTFQAPQTFETGATISSYGVDAADINGDGRPDLVFASDTSGPGVISALLNSTQFPTTISVTPSANPVSASASLILTATVTPTNTGGPMPTGTVTFFADGSSIGTAGVTSNGIATFSTTLAANSYVITASYGGDANYLASNSTMFTEVVTPLPAPTISLISSAGQLSNTQTVSLTATVAPPTTSGMTPTGMVTFAANGVTIGTATIQSDMTATLTGGPFLAGSYSITASYNGDSNYGGVTSLPITVTVIVPPPAKIGGVSPTFGAGGLAVHDVGFTATSDLLLQPDGKSVIIGTDGDSPTREFAVTRYNADGSLDTTFGQGGVFDSGLGMNTDDKSAAGYLLPNGDILAAGTATNIVNGQPAGSQFALVEYTPAGALDTTFGGGAGFVLTSFSSTAGTLSNDVAHAITVTATGEIFVAGSSDASGHGQDFAIAAYNPDGSLVTTFGTGGKVLLDIAGGDDSIAALALQPKGSILAAGSSTNPTTGIGSVALVRFLATGAVDPHFGNKGFVLTSVRGVSDSAASLAIVPKTGRIVVGGFSATGSAAAGTLSSDFLVLRYLPTGKLDRTFNNSGIAITSFNQPAAVTRVIAQSDGSIVATGKTTTSLSTINPGALDLAIARYTAAGKLDTSFNGTGQAIVTVSTTGTQSPSSLSLNAFIPFDTTSDLMSAFNQLTQSVQGVGAVTDGGILLDVGNSNGNTVEAAFIQMGVDLATTLLSSFPQAVVGGAKGTVTLQIKEAGNVTASGTVSVDLFATTTQDTTGQAAFQSIPARISLKQNKTKVLRLKFAFPSSLADGNYFIQVDVNAATLNDLDSTNNIATSATQVNIAKPFIDLTGSGLTAPVFSGTKPASISFTITNNGNIPTPAKSSTLQFFASTNGSMTNAVPLAIQPLRPNLKASSSHVLRTRLSLPSTVPAGSYFLLALLDPSNVFGDTNTANNLIVSGNMFVVG